MNMKAHILTALSEQFEQWENLLASLSESQITAPGFFDNWSIKDIVAHLWAWQQRSIARMEAVRLNREPEFPTWVAGLDPEDYAVTDPVNAWIYTTNRDLPWAQVHQNWRTGFQQLLKSADGITEKDLLDTEKYAWLQGTPVALVLLGTYDHHQEHIEKLQKLLK